MRISLFTLLILGQTVFGSAEGGIFGNPEGRKLDQEIFQLLADRSSLIVTARLEEGGGVMGNGSYAQFWYKFHCVDVLAGEKPASDLLSVCIFRRTEYWEKPIPCQKGEKYILFLRPDGANWQLVANFAGIQPYSMEAQQMVTRLSASGNLSSRSNASADKTEDKLIAKVYQVDEVALVQQIQIQLPEAQASLADAATLVQDGRLLWEMGKINDATNRLSQALKLDPNNRAAHYYLGLALESQRELESRRRGLDAKKDTGIGIKQVWARPIPGRRLPESNPLATTNRVPTGPGRQALQTKLESIRFDQVGPWDDLSFSSVVKILNDESRLRDPDKVGINFLLSPHIDKMLPQMQQQQTVDPQTGLPRATSPPVEVSITDLNDVKIKMKSTLRDVRLAEVLDTITKSVDPKDLPYGLKYSIEEYGIVFSQRTAATDPVLLYTRVFKVDPNTFIQGLQGDQGMPPIPDTSGMINRRGYRGSGMGVMSMGRDGSVGRYRNVTTETLRQFFSAALGVPFGVPQNQSNTGQPGAGAAGAMGQSGAGGAPGPNAQGTTSDSTRTLFFNDRTGQLFVRATMPELDIIEQAIRTLNLPPPQVCVEVKFVEIGQDDYKALGFDWTLGNSLMGGGRVGAQGGTAPSYSGTPTKANPLGIFPNGGTGGIPLTAGDKAWTNGLAHEIVGSVWRILTAPQFRMVIHALEQRTGVEVMSAPRVTTLTGRQAQVQVGTLNTNVMVQSPQGLQTNTVFAGFTTDVIPRVLPGDAIEMTLEATLTEFLGYTPSETTTARGAETARPQSNPPTSLLNLKPQFRAYQAGAQVTVWDGQTAVLEAIPRLVTLEAETAAGNDPQKETALSFLDSRPWWPFPTQTRPDNLSRKRLLVLVTPTIVDPAGNRINTEDNSPFDPNTIPPQPGIR